MDSHVSGEEQARPREPADVVGQVRADNLASVGRELVGHVAVDLIGVQVPPALVPDGQVQVAEPPLVLGKGQAVSGDVAVATDVPRPVLLQFRILGLEIQSDPAVAGPVGQGGHVGRRPPGAG